jgi:hypothetical protein
MGNIADNRPNGQHRLPRTTPKLTECRRRKSWKRQVAPPARSHLQTANRVENQRGLQRREDLNPIMANQPPSEPLESFRLEAIVCRESLGGLLKHYERKATTSGDIDRCQVSQVEGLREATF